MTREILLVGALAALELAAGAQTVVPPAEAKDPFRLSASPLDSQPRCAQPSRFWVGLQNRRATPVVFCVGEFSWSWGGGEEVEPTGGLILPMPADSCAPGSEVHQLLGGESYFWLVGVPRTQRGPLSFTLGFFVMKPGDGDWVYVRERHVMVDATLDVSCAR